MSLVSAHDLVRTPFVRELRSEDVADVKTLLAGLPATYPGAQTWLDRRLKQVLAGEARCLVADVRATNDADIDSNQRWPWRAGAAGASVSAELAGAVILTPKQTAMKISTIFVSPRWRRARLGTRLVAAALASTSAAGFDESFVTVAHTTEPQLHPLLSRFGFTPIALEEHRYGPGRHEWVFTRLRLR